MPRVNAQSSSQPKKDSLQDEVVPLFAFHHFLAQLHGAGGGHVGVFSQQVRHKRIAVRPVDARHDEQDVAQRDF